MENILQENNLKNVQMLVMIERVFVLQLDVPTLRDNNGVTQPWFSRMA